MCVCVGGGVGLGGLEESTLDARMDGNTINSQMQLFKFDLIFVQDGRK